ncbi:MAG: cellulase family glycosylhydrolase [Prevotellaceae bacterium]|nr:cellulase family glycosylhydrolase [Candidatus Minthosoma caballi]
MTKKLLSVLALVAVMLSSCVSTETAYVRVKDGKFYQGEKEYRYVGTNFWYGAILASEGRGGNRERLLKELDDMKSIGIDNVRVLIGGDGREGIPSHIAPKLQLEPGVYNDTILQGLDYMMAELEKRDMKAILYFNNAWEWSGGYGAYLDWAGFSGDVQSSDGSGEMKHFDGTPVPSIDGWWEFMQYVGNFIVNDTAKALAAQHVRNMVTRVNTVTGKPYTESPALMAWEIANEPRCFINDSLHRAKFVEWIDEQSTLIKSLDPNHLVTTGSEGMHGCEDSWELFEQIHTVPNIDYACIHIWPYNWGWLGKFNQNYDADKAVSENADDPIVTKVDTACALTLDYINRSYELMHKAGRPVVLEEFGYPRDRFIFTPGSPTKGRDAYYKYVFSIIRDSGKIAGCNFWGWGGSANVKHTIWQPYDDYVCDPAQEEQGLNSVFMVDESTLQIIKDMKP